MPSASPATALSIASPKAPSFTTTAASPLTNEVSMPEDDDIFGLEDLVPSASHSPEPGGGIVRLKSTDERGDGFDGLLSGTSPPSRPASLPSPVMSTSRAPSPPPHVLGQLVEMGFGVGQAKTALSATYDGAWNVQAAAEALMGAQEHDQRSQQVSNDAALAVERDEEERRRRHADRRRPTKSRAEISRSSATSNDESDLLAQASEIGLNVLNKASAYWQTGRKVVQKAVEERMAAAQASASSSSSGPTSNGGGPKRPKWMTTDVNDIEPSPPMRRPSPARVADRNPAPTLFHDDEDVDTRPTPMPAYTEVHRASVGSLIAPQPEKKSVYRLRAEEPAVAYVSPHRHRKPPTSPSTSHEAVPTTPARPTVSATPAQVAASEAFKVKGNNLYKLGRYADASVSYTSALDALPDRHLNRVVLLTNRAQSLLHNGESKIAIEDCTAALALLGVEGDIVALTTLTVASESASAGKALGRRAKAFEAAERWSSALEDWSLTQRAGGDVLRGAGGAKVVAEGAARCRRAIDPPQRPASQPPLSRRIHVTTSGAAVSALRKAHTAADAEEVQRLALKDQVDQRVTAWKGGKETNLRALIASLDSVLWDDFGWQKVGLHELVTESQLKIRYMKAIARLHPDKLIPANTALEHRMIANGVFSALNDAWNSHTSAR